MSALELLVLLMRLVYGVCPIRNNSNDNLVCFFQHFVVF